MTAVHLCATRGATALLGWNVRTGAGLFFMRAEAVDQIAEQCAGRIAIYFRSARSLQLHERVPGSQAALKLRLERIEFFPLLMPHEFYVANRAGVVEQQEEVFEQFQVLLELTPQSYAQDSMLFFQVEGPPPDVEGIVLQTYRPEHH